MLNPRRFSCLASRPISMLVKSVQLDLSRCAGRLPMAEAPKREASRPSTDALQSPLGAASRRA
eukprot:9752117-Alexandrium_andersonii.AAC.1